MSSRRRIDITKFKFKTVRHAKILINQLMTIKKYVLPVITRCRVQYYVRKITAKYQKRVKYL